MKNSMLITKATNANTVVPSSDPTCTEYVAEASDLGIPPGVWPRNIETTLGNCEPFVFMRHARSPLEFENAAIYRQRFSIHELIVLND